ncbi:MFS transporter, partial [Streptomyces sp. NRRL F-5126]|uniref:MFS transporter n=1 Tax=Streptomyces sp. NRRL F-5126 TaxID=1463857 RepID=UPI0004CC4976
MRKWWPLVAVSLGAFMLLIDVTIVNVALPAMAKDLGTSFSGLQWVVDIYALTLAALLLGAGTIADRLGHRRVCVAGLTIFALASLSCALAPSTAVLIAGRAVQGVGAAAMFATTIALLSTTYRGRDRGIAFGVWGAVNGAAAAAGPIIGGLLTQHLGWQWIFAVNVPVAVVAVAITWRSVAPDHGGRSRPLDLPGMAAFTLMAAAVTFGLIRSAERPWGDWEVWGPLALAALSLAAFLVVERRTAAPMLDLSLFRNRAFVGFVSGAALLSIGAWAMFPYASLWMQGKLGLGPVSTGLVIMPMSAVSFVVPLVMGRLGHGVRPRYSVTLGLLCIAAGSFLETGLDASATAGVLIPGMLCIGLGAGLALPPLSSAVMGAVPPERAGMAGGALNMARQLGLAIGVAVLGTVFSSVAGEGIGGPRASVASGLDAGYAVAGGCAVVGAALVLALTRPGRRSGTAHEEPAAAASREPARSA